jgi:hypothetical protein
MGAASLGRPEWTTTLNRPAARLDLAPAPDSARLSAQAPVSCTRTGGGHKDANRERGQFGYLSGCVREGGYPCLDPPEEGHHIPHYESEGTVVADRHILDPITCRGRDR